MAKKSKIEQIEKKLIAKLGEMQDLFPMPLLFTVVAREESGSGCEFMLGDDDPTEVMKVIKRSVKRMQEPAPKAKKKAKK